MNLFDVERLAGERIDRIAWDYYRSGAHDQITLADNRRAFDRISLHYRVLVDVSDRTLATTVLGKPAAMPLLIAPTAFQRLAHPDGELATARAAGSAGIPMVLSTLSTTPLEDVASATAAPVFFQLYVYKDRAATRALVERAEAAGCEALVLTVDAPLIGSREADVRNRFALPEGMVVCNLHAAGYGAGLPSDADGSGLAVAAARLLDSAVTWSDIGWLRSITRLPVVLKGIVRADDAARAARAGVDAIVVSNHGGRQLDTAPATIDVVGRVCDAVGDDLEVWMDGGVRRGTDVVKALAYGARAVLVGRPVLWGLGWDGEAGVRQVLEILRSELDLAMALCGCPTVADIGRDLVEPG